MDEDVSFKSNRKAGKPRIRAPQAMKEVTNTFQRQGDFDEEATVQISALNVNLADAVRCSSGAIVKQQVAVKNYTEEEFQKEVAVVRSECEAVSNEAVLIADSLLIRAEAAERELKETKNSMQSQRTEDGNKIKELMETVQRVQEEKDEFEKATATKVAKAETDAKQRVYDKVKKQFAEGNKEFTRVKEENDKGQEEIASLKNKLSMSDDLLKKANSGILKKKKENANISSELSDIKTSASKTLKELETVKEKLNAAHSKIAKLEKVNSTLQDKIKASEIALKDASKVEKNVFASKNELEKELIAARQNLAEQTSMNEQLVELLEKTQEGL